MSISDSLCSSIIFPNIQVFHEIIFKYELLTKKWEKFLFTFDKTCYFLSAKDGIQLRCKHSLKFLFDVYRACMILNTRFAVLTCFFSKTIKITSSFFGSIVSKKVCMNLLFSSENQFKCQVQRFLTP